MKKRIFASLLLVALLTGLFSILIAWGVLPGAAARRTEESLSQAAALLELRLPPQGPDEAFFNSIVSVNRITWIAADGTVRFDSQEDARGMDNHRDRPEVQEALATGSGSATRHSDTLSEDLLYYAQRLKDGSVLRLAAPVRLTRVLFRDLLPWLAAGVVASLVLSALLAGRIGKGFTHTIEQIDMDRPEEGRAYEELSPLLSRINRQNLQAQEQLRALQRQQQEMDALLNGMSEGFLVLDDQRRVQRINPSAAALLHVPVESAAGRSITELYRRPELLDFLDELQEQGTASATLPWDLRSYQWSASRLHGAGATVVLLRDVTRMVEGEAMRRRFTANVSHELRTPLTAICGYSEMLDNGMVQKDDEKEFIARINAESKRLLQLIEDILELSKLDEGYPGGRSKRLSLYDTAKESLQQFKPVAENKQVKLSLKGDKADVLGDPTLLSELINNLVDNAIKYNRQDGRVDLEIRQGRDTVDLTVHDTGIGIAPDQQDKIFERFYRTDNSRSKETGGTGLGLSIVKHSAEYHKATLQLDSQPGQGTSITVRFPALDRKKKKK